MIATDEIVAYLTREDVRRISKFLKFLVEKGFLKSLHEGGHYQLYVDLKKLIDATRCHE